MYIINLAIKSIKHMIVNHLYAFKSQLLLALVMGSFDVFSCFNFIKQKKIIIFI